jgi:hypothetical protein
VAITRCKLIRRPAIRRGLPSIHCRVEHNFYLYL